MPPRLIVAAIALLAVSACVSAPTPPPSVRPPRIQPIAPPPVPRPATPPPRSMDWRDAPLTPGDWSYAAGTARFGEGIVTLACDRAGASMALSVGQGSAGPATIRTSSMTRVLALGPDGGTRLGVRDPLLDAIAFSRGRFTVEIAGAAPLIVPVYAEIGRVIEDCR